MTEMYMAAGIRCPKQNVYIFLQEPFFFFFKCTAGLKINQRPPRPWPLMPLWLASIPLSEIIPHVQTGSRLPGTVWRGLIFFTTDRPDYHWMPPPAGDNHGWVVLAVRTGFALGHRASTFHRMRTFDNNSCAISITSPRSLFRPRTQHGRWGHREKSRRASTRWDCRGKSCLAGLSPLSGTPSERRDC